MKSDKLRPCPICNGKAHTEQKTIKYTEVSRCVEEVEEQIWFVQCEKCGFKCPAHRHLKTEQEAIAFWNKNDEVQFTPRRIVGELHDNSSPYVQDQECIESACALIEHLVDINERLKDECCHLRCMLEDIGIYEDWDQSAKEMLEGNDG